MQPYTYELEELDISTPACQTIIAAARSYLNADTTNRRADGQGWKKVAYREALRKACRDDNLGPAGSNGNSNNAIQPLPAAPVPQALTHGARIITT